MSHIFCTQCGFKIIYNHSKPNFCSKCGNSTDSLIKNNLSTSSNNFTSSVSNHNFATVLEDETDVNQVPEIGRLQVEIDSGQSNSFSFGSLFGQQNTSKDRGRRRNTKIDDFIDEKRSAQNI